MPHMKMGMVRSLAAIVVAAGFLGFWTGPAEAYDRGDCDYLFGAANISKVHLVKIDSGEVDFGDHPHWFGGPQGTAVICWANDGRVAIRGYVFADSRDDVAASTRIALFRSGKASEYATIEKGTYGNNAASSSVYFVSHTGPFITRVRIRLYNGGSLDIAGDQGIGKRVYVKNYYR